MLANCTHGCSTKEHVSSKKCGLLALLSLTSTNPSVPLVRIVVSASRHFPPFLPVPTGTDRLLHTCLCKWKWDCWNMLGSKTGFASASRDVCWEPMEKHMQFGKWHYIGCKKVTASNLAVKERRGIRPMFWGEQVLLMAKLVLLAALMYFLLLLAIMGIA